MGINAPKLTSVHRKEVYDAVRREGLAAAPVKPEDPTPVLSREERQRLVT